MPAEYLKKSYKWPLKALVVSNIVLFWAVAVSRADLSTVPALLATTSLKDGLFATLGAIACFLLDGILPADAKHRAVYWRWYDPLPGSRAFSKHIHSEARADPHVLARMWGELPNDPGLQNRLWYKIYESVAHDIRTEEAHRATLYARDLTAYSALLLVLLSTATFIFDTPWATAKWYLTTLALQYLVTMMAARTYGVRFVRTVLAIASTTGSAPTAQANNDQ